MSAFLLVEHDQKHLHPSTARVLQAALALDKQVILLVIGYQCEAVAKEAALLAGVKEIWYVDEACYQYFLAENISLLVAELCRDGKAILAPASTFGKDILPRVSGLLDNEQVSDVTKIISHDTFEHPIYAGNAIETVQVLDDKKIITVRPTAFEPVTEKQPPCPIKRIDKVVEAKKTTFIDQKLNQSARPELVGASIVVSGGRGLQSKEEFALIEKLADALGAAVGASRAAVDAGFVPNDYQVGQTGKIVAPSLYIAVGISGAIQHVAGMKGSKVIVAINKDEDAPIFQIADYGLVGDLFVLVPQLIELLKQR